MGYQQKSYKKFVATAATATLVASAIVPVASAKSFSDVDVTNDHFEAIDALSDLGVISGYTDGSYGVNKTVTRSSAVKILGKWLVNAQGFEIPKDALTVARFNDLPVDSADKELVEYAAVVKDAGVFTGSNGNLNAAGTLTRQQMAKVLVEAFNTVYEVDLVADLPKDFESKLTDLDSVGDYFTDYVKVLEYFEITKTANNTFNPTGSVTRGQLASFLYRALNNIEVVVELTVKSVVVKDAKTLEVTLSDDSKHTVTLEKALEANKATEVTFTIDEVEYKATVTYVVNELKVESVSAINLKEVTVTFDREVEKASAELVSNYRVIGNSVSKAILKEDGKTVVLLINSTFVNNTEQKLTVANVKSKDGSLTIASTEKTFTVSDTTIPTVAKVTAKSSTVLEVELTEPLNVIPTTAAFTLNGQVVTGSITSPTVAGSNKVTITLNNPLAIGTHKLVVNANNTLVDFAGYKVPTKEVTFDVVADTTVPVVSNVQVQNRTDVIVTFNKDVLETTVQAADFTWNTTDAVNATNVATSIEKIDGKTYKVKFTSKPLSVGEVFVVVDNTITDASGNPVARKGTKVTVVADATPEFTAVKAVTSGLIEVQYSKAMNSADVQSAANYILKNSLGTTVSLAGAKFNYDTTNNLVTIVPSSPLTDSKYTLTVKNVKDNVGTKITETTKEFTVTETTPPTLSSVRFLDEKDGAGKDVLVAVFSEPVATSGNYSVLNKAKWTLNGAALPTNATINVGKVPNEIEIHLNANYTATQALAINNFADLTGNVQTSSQSASASAAANGVDLSTATTANSVLVKDAKTIEFKLNQKLESINKDDFAVSISGGAVITDGTTNNISNISFKNTATGATVTVTLEKDLKLTNAYTVSTKATVTNTRDIDGTLFQGSKTTPESVNAASGNITSAYVKDATTLVVVVDQPVSSLVRSTDFVVSVNGTAKTATGATSSGNEITLTFAADTFTPASNVSVKTVEQALIQTETTNGKKLVAKDTFAANNNKPLSVALTNGAGLTAGTVEAGDKIVLTFSEAIDGSTLTTFTKNEDGTFTKAGAKIAAATAGTLTTEAGEIKINGSGAITLDGTVTADATLSADGKTLTYTITENTATIVTSAFTFSDFKANNTIKDTKGNGFNTDYQVSTSTKF